jgi:hypothetical protein
MDPGLRRDDKLNAGMTKLTKKGPCGPCFVTNTSHHPMNGSFDHPLFFTKIRQSVKIQLYIAVFIETVASVFTDRRE